MILFSRALFQVLSIRKGVSKNYRKLVYSGLVLLTLARPLPSLAKVVTWDLMHTRPECLGGTWCLDTEKPAMAELSGMEKRVAELMARAQGPAAKITVAYYSFSNPSSFRALCEAGKRGVQIEGFFDRDYQSDTTLFPNRLISQCQLSAETPNVKVFFLGAKEKTENGELKVWRLHHNKFLIVNSGANESVSFNFSSGNLSSSGLSIHFDHWVTLELTQDSNLLKIHQCVAQALKAAITGPQGELLSMDQPELYQKSISLCLKGSVSDPEQALTLEEIAPLFAPNLEDAVYKTLRANIASVLSGGRIYGAIQHFLHRGIRDDLTRAVKRGVDVRLIMDDDVVTGDSEVPGVAEFYQNFLKTSGVKIQFMKTNSGVMQMMHNKFLIMEKVKTPQGLRERVFSGAGHFTTSAMRNNYENFYLSQNQILTEKYKELFNYMWPKSISEEQAATPLNP